jgi:hypothetical protein
MKKHTSAIIALIAASVLPANGLRVDIDYLSVGRTDMYTPRWTNWAPVRREGTTLNWNDDGNALCWAIFKDGKYYKCITSTGCDITSDTQAKYTVRAANAMGGLGPVSDTGGSVAVCAAAAKMSNAHPPSFFNPARRTLTIQLSAAKNLKAVIYSLNGKKVLSKDFTAGLGTGKVEIPLGCIGNGAYLIRTEFDGSVRTEHIKLL